MNTKKANQLLERAEPIVMLLAMLSVILYLTDLQNLWSAEYASLYGTLMMTIDLVFFCDL